MCIHEVYLIYSVLNGHTARVAFRAGNAEVGFGADAISIWRELRALEELVGENYKNSARSRRYLLK